MLRLLLVFGAILVAVFVFLRLVSLGGDLAGAPALHRPALLMPAALLYAATLLAYAALWRELVCRLDHRRSPPLDGVAVFCASWVARYLPSGLPYVAGKFVLGRRLGHSSRALAASMLYEVALLVSMGVISSSVIVPLTLAGQGGGALSYVGAGLGGLALLGVLAPPVLRRIVSLGARIARKPVTASDFLLSGRDIAIGGALAAVALLCHGASFAFILGAFVDLDAREWVAAAAIANLAGVLGVAVLPVPSGLGVREAVLIGLLQLFVPIEVAAAAAVVMRLGGLGIDVLLGLAGAAVFALRQRRAALSERIGQPVSRPLHTREATTR